MKMTVRFQAAVVSVSVLLAWAGPLRAAGDGPEAGRKLRILSGEQTALKAIMQKWHDEELKRQGGKFGSHGWWLWGLTAFDYDNDGDADLLPTHHGTSGGLLLKNQFAETGKLTFVDATGQLGLVAREMPQGIGLRTHAIDLDGDGWLDLVGIRSPYYFNRQGKAFEKVGRKGFNSFGPVRIADLNGDGWLDFTGWEGARWRWDPKARAFVAMPGAPAVEARLPAEFLEQRKSLGRKTKDNPAGDNTWRLCEYFTDWDLNGDGLDDVVFQGWCGYNGKAGGRVFIAGKDGKCSEQTEKLGLPKDSAPILVRDLTGDGAADLLLARRKSAGVYVNDGRGRFALKPGPLTNLLRQTEPYLHRAYPVDLDDDGDADIVISKPRHGTKVVFENRGGGAFRLWHKMGGWCDSVAVCDVDGDGRINVVIGGPGNDITIVAGPEGAPGHFCNVYVRMARPNWTAAGAKVEVFRAGTLGKAGARPILIERAHADATPVHVGLGKAEKFDLRVTFPSGKRIERKGIEAAPKLKVTAGGKIERMD